MSTEVARLSLSRSGTPPCRSLAQYVTLLVERLDQHEPESGARLRATVGLRRARISLDDETVIVRFARPAAGGGLIVESNGRAKGLSGTGTTDRATVVALLDGYAEVTDVILDGRLVVLGRVDDVARMFQSIEVLIDGATRVPALQHLARDFRGDPCRARPVDPAISRTTARPPRSRVSPRDVSDGEMALLARLDLLPLPA